MLFLMQLFSHASSHLEYDSDEMYELYKELENCSLEEFLNICDILLLKVPNDYMIEKAVAICNDYRLASAFKIWGLKYDTAI